MLLDTTHIKTLPMQQKLELLELVCEALCEDSNNFESPSWHKDVLKSRETSLNKPETWMSLQDLKKSLYE